MMKKRSIFMFAVMTIFLLLIGFASATNITGCTILNSPDNYNLINSIDDSASSTCIAINSSDVFLDCGNFGNYIDGQNTIQRAISIEGSTNFNNITIRNCNITDWNFGIISNNIYNSEFKNIDIQRGFFIEAINISNSQNIIISDIKMRGAVFGVQEAITLGNTSYSTIKDSSFSEQICSTTAIWMTTSNWNNLTNLSFYRECIPILLDISSYNLIRNITIQKVLGISLAITLHSRNNNISNILMNDKGDDAITGIIIDGSNNYIEYANIYDYYNPSLFFVGAISIGGQNNTITKSYFSNNSWAIRFGYYSTPAITPINNLIYDNIFIENENATIISKNGNGVYRENLTNYFNITEYSGTNIAGGNFIGGNLWSNFNSTDLDGDGIWDMPYVINETYIIDYLPLNSTILSINYLPYLILDMSQISQHYGCVKPNIAVIIQPQAYDVENDTIYFAHKCSDENNLSEFTTNATKICIYSQEGSYNLIISVNDTENGIDYRTAYYPQLITVSDEECLCGYNNTGMCINIQIVNTKDINKGILPNIYNGMRGFLNNSFTPLFILVFGIIFIGCIILLAGLMAKLGRLGK